MNHCQKKCLGIDGNHGGCCTIGDRDFILGPIPDCQETLKRVQAQFPGVEITWDDLFISFEEGSNMFPDKPTWQNPHAYPCMRVNPNDMSIPCVFYNMNMKLCQIYQSKSIICSNYKCDYLQSLEVIT